MSRPSDDMTLEELREEYDWIYEFQSRMADRISGNPDVHNLVDYVNKLEAENARLRSEFESIGTVAYLYGRNDLKAENEKLRELVRELANDPDAWDYDYFKWRLRELGVDV